MFGLESDEKVQTRLICLFMLAVEVDCFLSHVVSFLLTVVWAYSAKSTQGRAWGEYPIENV